MMTKVCRGWLKEAIHRRDREAIERGLTELQAKTPREDEETDDPDIMLAEKMVRVLTVGDSKYCMDETSCEYLPLMKQGYFFCEFSSSEHRLWSNFESAGGGA